MLSAFKIVGSQLKRALIINFLDASHMNKEWGAN